MRLKRRREQLGMSEKDVAARVGLSVDAYGDLEAYPDEALNAVSLGTLRAVATVLGFDVRDLLGVESLPSKVGTEMDGGRHERIKRARLERGLSPAELGEKANLTDQAIQRLEEEPDAADDLSVAALQRLGLELCIDLRDLVKD